MSKSETKAEKAYNAAMDRRDKVDACIKRYKRIVRKEKEKVSGEELINYRMSLFYARSDRFNNSIPDRCVPGDMDLDRMMEFDDFSFLHDFYGVNAHICKDSGSAKFGKMLDCFEPRCGFATRRAKSAK